jgi:transposase InsO family protein
MFASGPGLLHLDTKKLARIPPGGGHRIFGRLGHRFEGHGYDYLHVAIDDCSRFAFVQIQPDERDQTTAHFVLDAAAHFAERGIRIERVLTDRGGAYRSHAFADALEQLGSQHRWTKPYRQQTNGKAERFIKTMLEEWAYARLYRSNPSRLTALPRWVAFYNRRRSHTALNGQTPATALVNNVGGNHN